MGTDIKPIVHKIPDDINGLIDFQNNLIKDTSKKEQNIILQFPTVYIHHWKETEDYEVYIGESNNVIQRTKQHYDHQGDVGKWQHNLMNIFDPSAKNYKKMTQNRTLSDGTKKQFCETLIQHEVRVLMTRGVEGLYVYAYDSELREALLAASQRS
jgi:hypothetical protein